MGYPLSEAGQKAFLSGGLQTVSIAVTLSSGETMTLTGANIRQGGLTIDRGCVKGEVFTLGTALAAELSLVLDNATGAFDNISFTGAEMNVSVSVTSGGTTYTCPMGIFIIDSETRTRYTVELAGMDYMTKFDKVMDLTDYIGTSTVIGNFIQDICTACGVTLRTASLSGLPNLSASFKLGEWQTAGDSIAETERTTYSCRQWLSWAVQLMGCIAYIDWEGQLRVRQYQSTTGFVKLSLGDMFSYNPAKDSFVYDTVALQFRDDTTYAGFLIGGGRSYLGYPIVGNSIAKYSNVWQYAGLVDNIASSLPKGFEDTTTGEWGGYTPFDAETMPIPWVWPGDSFSFYENADDAEPTSVSPTTHMCFALNGRCTLSCDWTTRNLFDTTLAYSPLGDQTQFSSNQNATIDGKLAEYLVPDGNGNVTIAGTYRGAAINVTGGATVGGDAVLTDADVISLLRVDGGATNAENAKANLGLSQNFEVVTGSAANNMGYLRWTVGNSNNARSGHLLTLNFLNEGLSVYDSTSAEQVFGISLPLSIARGGTGGTTAAGARQNLGFCYAAGDTQTIDNVLPIHGFGYSATVAIFEVVLDKSMENISSVAVTAMRGKLLGVNGLLEGSSDSFDWVASSSYSVTANIVTNHLLRLRVQKSGGNFGYTVNTPLIYGANLLTLTFA